MEKAKVVAIVFVALLWALTAFNAGLGLFLVLLFLALAIISD